MPHLTRFARSGAAPSAHTGCLVFSSPYGLGEARSCLLGGVKHAFRLTPPRRHDCLRQAVRGEHDALPFSLGASQPPFMPLSCTDPGNNWCDTDLRSKTDRKSTRLNSSHANISYAVF